MAPLNKEGTEENVLGRLTHQRILALVSVIFLVLPFVTTFNELFTRIVEKIWVR